MRQSEVRNLIQRLVLQLKLMPASSTCADSRGMGFTLIEVLVAMIVAAVFVSMTMQAIVTSTAFRVVATQYDEAVSWIQEDLEMVVNQATQYEVAPQPYSSRCLATLSSNGLAAGFLNDSVAGLGGTSTTIGPRALGGKTIH
ncbi:type II secretion system protein J [Acaryochloris sp. CCMEE 5410]|uniref:PulJ/GspJ family protein n=1 Tax=Acaryochloris sp. CCMEE 5410 TaxID=310037 RepID=UPI0002484361|nr:type II secretion system protein [Acaryochloris sp. CCMEE 5410]